MGHAQRRRGNTAKHKQIGKSRKTKRYQRDIDQIVNDLQPQNIIKFNIIQNKYYKIKLNILLFPKFNYLGA